MSKSPAGTFGEVYMDSDRIEQGKQVIPEDALTEIIYTIRTGLDKNDCIPASVSEWSLYNPRMIRNSTKTLKLQMD